MKIFSCLCLSLALISTISCVKAQDTIKQSSGNSTSSSLNSTNVQALIQANASKLQMLGISTTDAQNIANQVLPQIQSGTISINPSVNQSESKQENNLNSQTPVINNSPNKIFTRPKRDFLLSLMSKVDQLILQDNNVDLYKALKKNITCFID